MQKWEYQTLYFEPTVKLDDVRKTLQLEGDEGWELVSVSPIEVRSSFISSGVGWLYHFKRPKNAVGEGQKNDVIDIKK